MPAESYADLHCDFSRIHLSSAAVSLWPKIGDTARRFEHNDAFSPAATELRDWGLIFRLELGPVWLLFRTPRGMLWAMEQKRAA